MYKLKLRFSYVLFPFALMQKKKYQKEKIKTAFSRYSTSQFSGTKRIAYGESPTFGIAQTSLALLSLKRTFRYAQTAFCPYPKIAAFRFTLRK
ncbi:MULTISPECIES: hypothetical protein [Bacteroidales]|jgi:hypothetical protein|uniref:hypothetical protein n=1 Tax=Bacteroidales TaxID=171549 RepID=UPI00044F666F|nr:MULTISPECIES: hypothetical protein [Bacteroidales]MSD54555.1 hypothetical protein [Faecalibacterium prausnitzii]RHR73989.1 hypothetical protein DWW52_20220 [Odoribacter sp. AF15-53]EXZ78947.1 hypothetical protein M144_1769 [Bacteroides fragilis str. 3-F-2 \